MASDVETRPASTRERILVEALRLFARQGYRGTSIAQIEQAAGLSPGSGGLYKHFPSKEALLAAALDRYVNRLEAVGFAVDLPPLGDVRSELMFVARSGLRGMRADEEFVRILMREADQFPALLAEARQRLIHDGFAQMADWLRLKVTNRELRPHDCEAVAAVGLGALVNYASTHTFFGSYPADVDEERFLRAWVEMMMSLAARGGAR